MKKTFFYLVSYTLIVTLLCFTHAPLLAQTPPNIDSVLKLCDRSFTGGLAPTENSCEPGSVAVEFDADCLGGYISIAAFAVDLDNYYDYALIDPLPLHFTMDWPEELPPVYLAYDFYTGGDTQIVPVTSWIYVAQYTPEEGGPVRRIYEGEVRVRFPDLSDYNCDDEEDLNYQAMNLAMVTDSDTYGGYSLYPIENFGTEGDLFSCDVFVETCNLCTEKDPNCVNSAPPANQLFICIDCGSCTPGGDFPPDPQQAVKRGLADGTKGTFKSTDLQVTPNPFSDFVQYTYQASNAAEVLVRLLRVDGQVIQQTNEQFKAGSNQLFFDTSTLPAGAYYLQVLNGQDNPFQKLIKLE